MMRNWLRTTTVAALGCVALSGVVLAQNPAPGQQPAGHRAGDAHVDLPGPIDSVSDLQDTAKMLFKLADTNNDGQISQKEAVDAGNLLVGGFFFRADTNGDGKVSREEARAARESLYQQNPMLRMVIQRAKTAQGQAGGNASQNPAANIARLLDSNNDQALEATELRQAVQTGVQALYAQADTNRDGQLSPSEINAATIGALRAAQQAAFQEADSDHNGMLSRQEFDQALIKPANAIFAMVDANNDGQLTQDELRQARRLLIQELRSMRLPDAPNSARAMLNSGQNPDQVAPVPNFGTNRQGNAGQPQPAPAPR
jgi:Ca2+-binding EF-hand superfamily protein